MASFSAPSTKPLPSHNFVVHVGITPIPFSRISSLEIGVETEALSEGGENRFVHSLARPVAAEKSLVMERGVNCGLAGAVASSTAASLRVGAVYNFLIICVLDQGGAPKKMYVANHAILKKRRFSDLNAMSGEVFVETLEFIYRDMTEVPDAAGLFSLLTGA